MIDVLIPTLGRPDRLPALAENIAEATAHHGTTWFIIEAHDVDSYEVIRSLERFRAVPLINQGPPSYAGAINTGYRASSNPWLFAGADDLRFHPAWDRRALDVAFADDGIAVIGTNDLLNPYVAQGLHATHYLVRRSYLDEVGGQIDAGPGSFLNEVYGHNWVDTEFVGTARHRGVFRPCLESVVEHLHWSAGRMEQDATSAKTWAHVGEDEALFRSRCHLWGGLGHDR